MAISAEAEKLFGTDEPTPERVRLAAGPLSLELEGGAIRYIRYGGHEAIRGIEYLVRDSSWRTPPARFTTVRRDETPQRFVIELDAEVKEDDIHCRFRLSIEGKSSGSLEVRADGEALSGFLTNRIGFVVLHPILGVAGRPVTVTHRDGSVSQTRFPELISPSQPIFDIRALHHEVAPGRSMTCRMEAALPRDILGKAARPEERIKLGSLLADIGRQAIHRTLEFPNSNCPVSVTPIRAMSTLQCP